MAKGFLLKSLDGENRMHLYIPAAEKSGPLWVDRYGGETHISAEEDPASELTIRDGESADYRRIAEIKIPPNIVDFITSLKGNVNDFNRMNAGLNKIFEQEY